MWARCAPDNLIKRRLGRRRCPGDYAQGLAVRERGLGPAVAVIEGEATSSPARTSGNPFIRGGSSIYSDDT